MITAIELALNHLDHAELVERVDVLEPLLAGGHAIFADRGGHIELVTVPAPTLPALPFGVA